MLGIAVGAAGREDWYEADRRVKCRDRAQHPKVCLKESRFQSAVRIAKSQS